jgi:hypothetical protein
VQECLEEPFLPLQAEERAGSGAGLVVRSSSSSGSESSWLGVVGIVDG